MRKVSLDLLTDKDSWHPRAGLDGASLNVAPSTEADLAPLLALMPSLKQRELELLVAIFWHKRSQRDIARQLGISQPAVHYRYQTILRKLRKALDEGPSACCVSPARGGRG